MALNKRAVESRCGAVAAVLLAMVLLSACGGGGPAGPGGQNRDPGTGNQAIEVVTELASVQPLPLEIESVGTAFANQSVELTSKAANIVTAIHFAEGQRVRRGQVLVELDSTHARAELAGAEAALAESRANYERSRQLESSQVLSRAQMDQIEASLKTNQAAVEAAKARLADTVIRAPFDGTTGFRNVSVGSLVSPGTVITTLDDTSIIKLDFTVPQTYLGLLELGDEITARANGLPNREFKGRIAVLGSRIDPVTRSITVRAELPNPDGTLRPGMFMSVTLRAEAEPVLTVAESALVPEQGSVYVFVVANGQVEQRKVTTGRRRPGLVEITSGLKEGERVIVDGTLKVRHGSRVVEAAAPKTDDPPITGAPSSHAPVRQRIQEPV